MELQDILQDIINGKMTRDKDEKYAGGLWDYAGEIVYDTNNPVDENLQSKIYHALWEIADFLVI